MLKINYEKLKEIYDSLGERKGWDFSTVRREKEKLPWDYKEIILKYLKPTDKVLDVGTGGGEFFIGLAKNFSEGIGIDFDNKMIDAASENLSEELKNKVSFLVMDAKELEFPREYFDIVINRHAPIYPKEISKVLKKGGYFITQQVGGENAQNIHEVFGWPTNAEFWAGHYKDIGEKTQSMEVLPQRFVDLNFKIVRREDAKIKYWFKDNESLVFWLKSVPLPEEFNPKKHWKRVSELIEKYSTSKGIQTTQHRELLVVKKAQ